MPTDISRSLSLLRREKGVSQRAASRALGISQALLSHYETGSREPGLAFVKRACDYYEVSADFMLGRTLLREGGAIPSESLHDASGEKANRLSGQSASALLGKKLVVNAVSVLFDLAGRSGRPVLVADLTRFFGTSVYKIFRHFYQVSGANADTFFPVPAHLYSEMAAADMARAEACLLARLRDKDGEGGLPPLSHESLAREYPALVQSLFKLVHEAGARCRSWLEP